MFTGIIEAVGTLKKQEGNVFTFTHPFEESFEVGESVALSGMCGTVLRGDETLFSVEIIEESRRLTVFNDLKEGALINLERSAIIGQRNSGHNVQGHVDECGTILEIREEGDYQCLRISYSEKNKPLVIYKGSVALDGISLTVSNLSKSTESPWFEVSIISHTWEQTNLHSKKKGEMVHLEFDVAGKYLHRFQALKD